MTNAIGILMGFLLWGPIGYAIGARSDRGWKGYLLGCLLGIIGVGIAYFALKPGSARSTSPVMSATPSWGD